MRSDRRHDPREPDRRGAGVVGVADDQQAAAVAADRLGISADEIVISGASDTLSQITGRDFRAVPAWPDGGIGNSNSRGASDHHHAAVKRNPIATSKHGV
jgi:hypothetical protein